MNRLSLFLLCLAPHTLNAWSGMEPTGAKPIFYGSLTSREGTHFTVSNIVIGTSKESNETIRLYEKPKELDQLGHTILINPYQQLTTTQLDLTKIQSITVPAPDVTWKWIKESSKRSSPPIYEFIELQITWKESGTINYLLELGLQTTNRPVKVFCNVTPITMPTEKQEGTLFCKGLPRDDVRQKGAPFTAIKELVIDNYCYKLSDNKKDKNKPSY